MKHSKTIDTLQKYQHHLAYSMLILEHGKFLESITAKRQDFKISSERPLCGRLQSQILKQPRQIYFPFCVKKHHRERLLHPHTSMSYLPSSPLLPPFFSRFPPPLSFLRRLQWRPFPVVAPWRGAEAEAHAHRAASGSRAATLSRWWRRGTDAHGGAMISAARSCRREGKEAMMLLEGLTRIGEKQSHPRHGTAQRGKARKGIAAAVLPTTTGFGRARFPGVMLTLFARRQAREWARW